MIISIDGGRLQICHLLDYSSFQSLMRRQARKGISCLKRPSSRPIIPRWLQKPLFLSQSFWRKVELIWWSFGTCGVYVAVTIASKQSSSNQAVKMVALANHHRQHITFILQAWQELQEQSLVWSSASKCSMFRSLSGNLYVYRSFWWILVVVWWLNSQTSNPYSML